MTYRIVNTDNFAGDYPAEYFVGPEFIRKEDAQTEADKLNKDAFSRWHKVVELPYELQPGFEP